MTNTQSRTEETKARGTTLPVQKDDQQKVPIIYHHYDKWPTSKPGPLAMQPPPGQRPINALRPEQMEEVAYDQSVGEPSDKDQRRYNPDEAS
jgi:hypothetical protein